MTAPGWTSALQDTRRLLWNQSLEQIPENIRNVDTEESRQVSEGRSLGLVVLWTPEMVLLELSGEKEGGLEIEAPQQGVRGQWHGGAQGIWGRWASGDASRMGCGVLIPPWASRTVEKCKFSYSVSVVRGIVGLLEPWVLDMSSTLWQV